MSSLILMVTLDVMQGGGDQTGSAWGPCDGDGCVPARGEERRLQTDDSRSPLRYLPGGTCKLVVICLYICLLFC